MHDGSENGLFLLMSLDIRFFSTLLYKTTCSEIVGLIVIGSVLFWKFSTETGASGGENTTTRENLNSMNNYCYLTNNSNNCARTTGRTPDRVNLDDERSARSQLIELTQLRKSEVSV